MNDTKEQFEARVEKWEDYYEEQDKRENQARRETFLSGVFAGFGIGVIYLAIMHTVLERI
jgi:hypothetical protein